MLHVLPCTLDAYNRKKRSVEDVVANFWNECTKMAIKSEGSKREPKEENSIGNIFFPEHTDREDQPSTIQRSESPEVFILLKHEHIARNGSNIPLPLQPAPEQKQAIIDADEEYIPLA